ncbi:uncharacterized protein LOC131066764 isoform X2 [Cryptomeria japonica]|uniref:uncharacterized protein LOC131066764 isoform X2 n=1 Tax=Cryptomeria japonica TaxID=3369 RepID=UPI0027DA6808|nr:uncharacterized protein LOC131066764 isoform X2 [Cryptomeria japonica]
MAQQQHKNMQLQVTCDLERRVEELERSHAELREDVETLARIHQQIINNPNPFLRILQLMGHAVFLFAPSSREITFWCVLHSHSILFIYRNQSAEALYGWKDYEVLGKDFIELLVDKSEYNVAKEILRRLCMGLSWAGLFPLKKKSGGIFTAMVTDTPLYENGVVVGVITVSSDAFVFRNANNICISGYNPCGRQNLGYSPAMLPGLDKPKVEQKQPLRKTSTILKMVKKMLSCLNIEEENADLHAAYKYNEGLGQDCAQVGAFTKVVLGDPSSLPSLQIKIDSESAIASHLGREHGPVHAAQSADIAAKPLSDLCIEETGSNILAKYGSDVGLNQENTNPSKLLSKFIYGEEDNELRMTTKIQQKIDQRSLQASPSPKPEPEVLSRLLPGESSNKNDPSTGDAERIQESACSSSSKLASKIYSGLKQEKLLHCQLGEDATDKDEFYSTKLEENESLPVLRIGPNPPRSSLKTSSRHIETILDPTTSKENELEEKGLEKMSELKVISKDCNQGEFYRERSGLNNIIGGKAESSSNEKDFKRHWLGYGGDSRKHIQRDKCLLQGSGNERKQGQPTESMLNENITNDDSSSCPHAIGETDLSSEADCEILWKDLVLGEQIGKGFCGVVFHGLWHGSDVAIKAFNGREYSDEVLQGLKKEVSIMKRLRHPNVLLFMGAVYAPEHLAIVTELLPRGSLFKILHKSKRNLELRHRLRMALDVARGMSYLHRRKPPIIHRDLKSSSLLVDKNWTVKVGDFGLSQLKNATFLSTKVGKGSVRDTELLIQPNWMAPEVLRNESSNEKSDVYSFGVILWELVTSQIPWDNCNALQVIEIVGFMDFRPEIPDGLDPKLTALICDCWHSELSQRPSFESIVQRIVELIRLQNALRKCNTKDGSIGKVETHSGE